MTCVNNIGTSASDYLLFVSQGRIPNAESFILAGHNGDIDLGVAEDLWEAGGFLQYLSAAETMNIVSSSVNDDGAPAGTGARTVLVSGLDGNYDEINEIVTMDGLTNVLTVNSYLRVHTLLALTAGTSETNEGTITATASGAATVQCQMAIGKSLSKNSQYTIPNGREGYLIKVELGTHRLAGGQNPNVSFRGLARPFGGPWVEGFEEILDADVQEFVQVFQPMPPVFTARTDIRIEVLSDTNGTEVTSRGFLLQLS